MEGNIVKYVERLREMQDKHWDERDWHHPKHVFSYKLGRKYAKIITVTEAGAGQRMVHSFVDLKTGDILKAASWNAPAKKARGSVLDLDAGGFSIYGANYL